eukprot:scaffold59582_cov35-Phaeocystis_antarctica.AAC.1
MTGSATETDVLQLQCNLLAPHTPQHALFRGAPQAAHVAGGRQERRDGHPQAAARQEAATLHRRACGFRL